MDGLGTGFWFARQIYATVKRRLENATREMVERAVREEVERQLYLQRPPGIEINVQTVQILVDEVIAIAVREGMALPDEFPRPARVTRPRAALAAPLPEVLALPPPDQSREVTAHSLPSPERVAAMSDEFKRVYGLQFGNFTESDGG